MNETFVLVFLFIIMLFKSSSLYKIPQFIAFNLKPSIVYLPTYLEFHEFVCVSIPIHYLWEMNSL